MKILTDSTTGKAFLAAQNKALILPQGVDLNLRHYEFTVDENTTYPFEAVSDGIIAEHYNDSSARILIAPKSNIVENDSTYSVTMAIGGNVSADGKYQTIIRTNHSSGGAIFASQPISTQTSGNTYLQALLTGKIILFPYGSSYYFAAGTYDLYFMW